MPYNAKPTQLGHNAYMPPPALLPPHIAVGLYVSVRGRSPCALSRDGIAPWVAGILIFWGRFYRDVTSNQPTTTI